MLYFYNPGILDLRALTLHGVSVKETKNAIGMFGTGMKYAIAVIMRNGGSITIERRGHEPISITKTESSFRGEPIEIIRAGDTELPFSTNYGKNWELWMAYRELLANAKDEGGDVTTAPISADTVIRVNGLDQVHANRKDFMLDTDAAPLARTTRGDIYKGESVSLFYQGFKVFQIPPSMLASTQATFSHTYNITAKMDLTEDRTASVWEVHCALRRLLCAADQSPIYKAFLTDPSHFEHALTFSMIDSYPQLAATVQSLSNDAKLNSSCRNWLSQKKSEKWDTYHPSPLEVKKVNEALERIAPVLRLDFNSLRFVESAGENMLAFYDQQTELIYLTRDAVAQGGNHLASTLLEEGAHKIHGFRDESRRFQQWLLDRVVEQLELNAYYRA